MSARLHRGRARGTTLLETMIVVGVFSILLIAFFLSAQSTVTANGEEVARSELSVMGLQAMRAIESAVTMSGRITITYSGTISGNVVFPCFVEPCGTNGANAIWTQADGTTPVAGITNTSTGVFSTTGSTIQVDPGTQTATALKGALTAAVGTGSLFWSHLSGSPATAGDTPSRYMVFIEPGFVQTWGSTQPATWPLGVPDIDTGTSATTATGQWKWRSNAIHSFEIEKTPDGVHQLVEKCTSANSALAGTGYPQAALADGATKHILARNVERVVFEDQYYKDPSSASPTQVNPYGLAPDQIRVTIFLTKLDPRGRPLLMSLQSIVNMRCTPQNWQTPAKSD